MRACVRVGVCVYARACVRVCVCVCVCDARHSPSLSFLSVFRTTLANSPDHLTRYCQQIADGMAYLAKEVKDNDIKENIRKKSNTMPT